MQAYICYTTNTLTMQQANVEQNAGRPTAASEDAACPASGLLFLRRGTQAAVGKQPLTPPPSVPIQCSTQTPDPSLGPSALSPLTAQRADRVKLGGWVGFLISYYSAIRVRLGNPF